MSMLLKGSHLFRLRSTFWKSWLLASIWIGLTGCGDLFGQAYGNPSPLQAASGISTLASGTQNVLGQVVSATTGLPVFRALVRLNDRATLTDHEGKFEFPQYSVGSSNRLQVSKPGFYSSPDAAPNDLMLRPDELAGPVEVKLYPEALLTGTLTRPDGSPLEHISVSARRSTYADQIHRWQQVAQTQTDSHGNFRLTVPAGEYKLETGYSAGRGSSEAVLPLMIPGNSERSTSDVIKLPSGGQEHFDLQPALSRTYTVRMQIDSSGERGFPMINVRSSSGLTFPANSFGRSGSPGEMQIELPIGTFTLVASQGFQDSMRYGEATVTITDHDVSGLVLHMADVSPISVELVVDSDSTSDKTPPSLQQLGITFQSMQDLAQPAGTMVALTSVRDGGSVFRAMPGAYRLEVRGANSWYVKRATYGATDLLDKELTVSAGASGGTILVTVSDRTGSLAGTTSLNGALAACWVYLIPTGPSASSVFTVRSNAEGIYNFQNLPPGSYRAIAFQQRYSANFRDPNALDHYATHLGSVSVAAGNKASLDLSAVAIKEIAP